MIRIYVTRNLKYRNNSNPSKFQSVWKKRIIVNGIPKHTKRTAQFFGIDPKTVYNYTKNEGYSDRPQQNHRVVYRIPVRVRHSDGRYHILYNGEYILSIILYNPLYVFGCKITKKSHIRKLFCDLYAFLRKSLRNSEKSFTFAAIFDKWV